MYRRIRENLLYSFAHAGDNFCQERALASASRRGGRPARARARRGHRRDPGHHRPRGARLRPPLRGNIRPRGSYRSDRGAAPVPRPGAQSLGRPRARPGGVRGPRRRGAAPGPDARRAAVRLPRRGPRGLAANGRGRPPRPARPRAAEPAGRVDLRLHRRALGRLGGGLRGSPIAGRGRTPPPPAGADSGAVARPTRRRARAAHGRRGRGLAPAAQRRGPGLR